MKQILFVLILNFLVNSSYADHMTSAALQALARETLVELEQKTPALSPEQRQSVAHDLRNIQYLLSGVPAVSPFRYKLEGDTLTVYNSEGKLIVTWNHHDQMEVRGNVLALLDSNKEFGAFLSDGTRLVERWMDVIQYWLMDEYVGLLDKNGVFEAYSARIPKALIKNWRDTVKVIAKQRYIGLLDRAGIFQGYTRDGLEVIRLETVADIEAVDETTIRYQLKNGVTKTFPIAP